MDCAAMKTDNVLRMWTLYENPRDFPGMFVLREWAVTGNPDGEPRPLPGVFVAPRLEPLRAEMERRGLFRMPRNPDDEPQIVETWI
jgi:hypothetical protein